MFVITDSFQLERLALVVPFLKQSSMYNTFEVSKHLTVSLFEDFSHEIVIMLLLRNTTLILSQNREGFRQGWTNSCSTFSPMIPDI